MNEKIPFLRWLVINSVTLSGLFILWQTGLVSKVWDQDQSFISATILVFFFFMSTYVGMATWKACKILNTKNEAEVGWFSSELCLGLGMLGTVIGLVMMLSGFNSLDPSNSSSVQELLRKLGSSMGTALYTTMTGLACGMVLKIQTFNLELAQKP